MSEGRIAGYKAYVIPFLRMNFHSNVKNYTQTRVDPKIEKDQYLNPRFILKTEKSCIEVQFQNNVTDTYRSCKPEVGQYP